MKLKLNISSREIIFVAATLLLILILSIVLYLDVNRKIIGGGGKTIGTIVFKNNVVRRKYTNQVIWEELFKSAPLHNRDTIYTGTVSDAKLILKDGTVIEVGEDSLIIMDIEDEEVRIKLESGTIQAIKGKNTGTDTVINITHGDKKIVLVDGELKVSKSAGKDLALSVQNGEASVDIAGQVQSVKAGQDAVLTQKGAAISITPVLLKSPVPNARLLASKKNLSVAFSWKLNPSMPKKPGAVNYTLTISKDILFTKIIKKTTLRKTGTQASLPPGSYYWHITGKKNGKLLKGNREINRFSVIKDPPIYLLNPINRRVLEYVDRLPFVHFSWIKNPNASSYRLEISEDKKFTKIIKTLHTPSRRIAYELKQHLKPAETKIYYWRVKTVPGNRNWKGQTSPAFKFSVKRKTELAAPRLVYPDNSATLPYLPQEKNLERVFNWTLSDDCTGTKIYFSGDKNFKTILNEFSSIENHWTMKKPFPDGRYYWRVRGFTSDGKQTPFSATRSFRLVTITNIALLAPPKNGTIEFYDYDAGGLTFTWRRLTIDGTYRLEIANDKSFKSMFATESLTSPTIKIADITPGTYYWRVTFLDEKENEILKSPVSRLTINNRLKNPAPIYPAWGRVIDMTLKKSLAFRWKQSKKTNEYEFKLFQVTGTKEEPASNELLALTSNKLHFDLRDLTKLDMGNFYWTLQAIHKDRSGKIICTSKKLRNNFSIHISFEEVEIETEEEQIIK
ncbi:MAG: FecR domain-containing protein [bacterium]|nr:FecR domain-containing protein [bacterium]